MINELKAMAIFAEVVKCGSFREAAKKLSLSPSVVSYHISQLEQKTGSALLYRSTRKLTLSNEGEAFYQQVQKMLEAANKGIDLLSEKQKEPSGTVKVSLPTALSKSPISEAIAQFALKYPKVTLELNYSDTNSDIIDERTDLTIRAGKVADNDFKSTSLGSLERVLVCAPTFYRQHIPAQNPGDLNTWAWLKLSQLPNKRLFLKGNSRKEVAFTSQITLNSVEAIYQFCVNGNGLAVLAKPQVENDIKSGKLINVLPEWQVEPLPLYALWPKNINKNSATKKLIEALKDSADS